jgi:hypothetical protein
MAQAVYNNAPAYMEIDTFTGNSDTIACQFAMDLTGYTFTMAVFDASNKQLFSVNGIVSGVSPNQVVTYSISSANNLLVGQNATYVMYWTVGGATKAWCAGPFSVGFP